MQTNDFLKAYEPLDRKLYAFALKLTKNDFDAKDLLQETATRAFQHRDSFKEGTNFKAWISTILRNTFINNYRKRRVLEIASEPIEYYDFNLNHQAVYNLSESEIVMKELGLLLNQIDEMYRIPFLMAYQGYSYQEIAEEMNIPLGTIKSRIHTARKQLRILVPLYYQTQDSAIA